MSASGPLGVIPESWTLARLGELTVKVGSGATPTGGEKAYLESRQTHALIRSQCVHDREFDLSSLSYISDEQAMGLRNARVLPGDVLLNITGDGATFARAAMVPDAALPAYVNQHVAILRADPRVLSPGYLLAFLTHPEAKKYIEGFNSGGSRRAITKAHILSFELPLPPLVQQEAIALTLGALDNKIELNRLMNETLDAMAQAIFRDWFADFGPVRRRMEGATDPVAIMGGLTPDPARAAELVALFPGRLGKDGLPEGWSERPLDQIADFMNGLALQKFPAVAGEPSLPVIKIAELRNGVSDKSNRAAPNVPEKYIVRDGDYLFSWSGSLVAKVWTEGEGALNQHLFKVSSKTYPQWFYGSWVERYLPEFQRIAASKATTMGHIQRSHLTAAMTVCPPSGDLETMSSVLAPLWDRRIHNDLENRTLAETCDYLLPRLMSGQVRVRATPASEEATA